MLNARVCLAMLLVGSSVDACVRTTQSRPEPEETASPIIEIREEGFRPRPAFVKPEAAEEMPDDGEGRPRPPMGEDGNRPRPAVEEGEEGPRRRPMNGDRPRPLGEDGDRPRPAMEEGEGRPPRPMNGDRPRPPMGEDDERPRPAVEEGEEGPRRRPMNGDRPRPPMGEDNEEGRPPMPSGRPEQLDEEAMARPPMGDRRPMTGKPRHPKNESDEQPWGKPRNEAKPRHPRPALCHMLEGEEIFDEPCDLPEYFECVLKAELKPKPEMEPVLGAHPDSPRHRTRSLLATKAGPPVHMRGHPHRRVARALRLDLAPGARPHQDLEYSLCVPSACTVDSDCAGDHVCDARRGRCHVPRNLTMYADACRVTDLNRELVKERDCPGVCGRRAHNFNFDGQEMLAHFCEDKLHSEEESSEDDMESSEEEMESSGDEMESSEDEMESSEDEMESSEELEAGVVDMMEMEEEFWQGVFGEKFEMSKYADDYSSEENSKEEEEGSKEDEEDSKEDEEDYEEDSDEEGSDMPDGEVYGDGFESDYTSVYPAGVDP